MTSKSIDAAILGSSPRDFHPIKRTAQDIPKVIQKSSSSERSGPSPIITTLYLFIYLFIYFIYEWIFCCSSGFVEFSNVSNLTWDLASTSSLTASKNKGIAFSGDNRPINPRRKHKPPLKGGSRLFRFWGQQPGNSCTELLLLLLVVVLDE